MTQETDAIAQRYGLCAPVVTRLIHDGIDNRVYLVTDASDQKYVLRESKRPHANRSIDFEAATIDLLIGAGISTPAIIPTTDGGSSVVIGGHDATLFEYVSGTQFAEISPGLIGRGIVAVGARTLGKMHSVTRGQKLFAASRRTIFSEFERFIAIAGDPILKALEGYDVLASNVSSFKERAVRAMQSGSVELGIIHNDYRVQNLIFQDDAHCSVIDFDWACEGALLKDVGLAVAEWSMFDFASNAPSQPAVDAFLAAYNETAPSPISYGDDLLFWTSFSCLSDACTFFVDLVEGRYEGKAIARVDQCRMYRKFRYFKEATA